MQKILIVDDNDHLVSFLEKKLSDAGHKVVTAFSGISAVKALLDYTPDIIFCDYFLPNFNGDKLCQIIRKIDPLKDAYIVIMTAAASELNLDPSEIGADAVMAKGAFQGIEKHVFALISEVEARRAESQGEEIIGIDSVFPRRMTKELLMKNRHLQTILDSISEGILELSGGRIAYANPTAEKILGLSEDQLLAVPLENLFDEQAGSQIASLLAAGSADIATIERLGPKHLRDKMLSVKKLPFQGDSNTTLLLITDISEKMQTEKLLLDHQGRQEKLVHELQETNANLITAYQWMRDHRDLLKKHGQSEEIAFIVDRDGKIEWITEVVQEQTALSRLQLLDGNIADLFTNESRERVRETLKQAWHGIIGFIPAEMSIPGNSHEMFEMKVTRITAEANRRLLVLLQRPVPELE